MRNLTTHLNGFVKFACMSAVVLAISLVISGDRTAAAVDLGVVGATYPIVERDMAEEVKAKAKNINWQEMVSRQQLDKKAREFRPNWVTDLPRALEEKTRLVSMDYALEHDVTDDKGNVIYPKGFVFNPLDYVTYPRVMAVFDGSDREQVDWFKHSEYAKNANVLILITGGSYYELQKELKNSVYYLDKRIATRFQLRYLPSVAYQKTNMMEVKEFVVQNDKKSAGK